MGRRAKTPEIYWKKSHQCFYVKLNTPSGRKETRLDPDEETARQMLYKCLAGKLDLSPKCKAEQLIEAFLDSVFKSNKASTAQWYADHCYSFLASLPKGTRIDQLKGHDLKKWIENRFPAGEKFAKQAEAARATWQRGGGKGRMPRSKPASDTTRHGAMRAVQRAFNWAVEMGLIERSPFDKVKKPQPENRDAYLWPEQFDELMGHIKDEAFRDTALVFRQTGCRPLELRTVEARQIDWVGGYWKFEKGARGNKNKKRVRFVKLNEVAQEICRKWADRYPDGPIFRNMDGNPWRKNALIDRCRRLRTKVPFQVTPYSLRHTFATDAIIAGVDLVTVARLLGHRNLDMLNEIYEHVQVRDDFMSRSVEKATAQASASARRFLCKPGTGDEAA